MAQTIVGLTGESLPVLFRGALRSRPFRLLWFGLLCGSFGSWTQFTTLTYFVADLAHTPARAALFVGLLGASRAVAVLACSPVGGVLADRYPRRRILMVTNCLTSFFSLLLAVLTSTHLITIPEILALAFCLAATSSFDSPARQSWIPSIVPREDLANAIGLGQFAFNAPSVIGPPIAGLLIVAIGVGASFYVNAVAQLAVLAAVIMMPSPPAASTSREPMLRAMYGGVRFVAGQPVLKWIALTLVINALLLRPYTFLLSAYALHVVHTDARGLGWLMASAGLGAMIGTVFTAVLPTQRQAYRWAISATAMGLGMLALGLSHAFFVSLGILFFLGLGNLSFTGTSNVLIQTLAPDEMRGRAISVYSMTLQGMVPTGTLVLGAIAFATDLSGTLVVAGLVGLALLAWTWFAHPALRAA